MHKPHWILPSWYSAAEALRGVRPGCFSNLLILLEWIVDFPFNFPPLQYVRLMGHPLHTLWRWASLFSSLLPSKIFYFNFFSMPAFWTQIQAFCQILHAGYGEDVPPQPHPKSFQHSVTYSSSTGSKQYDIRGRRERSWEFCFVKYYHYSIILCLYTHWRENVVMSKEVISSAGKLLICSITSTGYGCHMVGHSS